jgi:hypothetical protein
MQKVTGIWQEEMRAHPQETCRSARWRRGWRALCWERARLPSDDLRQISAWLGMEINVEVGLPAGAAPITLVLCPSDLCA